MRAETNLLAALDIPLTHRQYRILRRVATGVTSQTAISRAASISVAAISESADALMRRGLLDRETDERDRRASRLSLTEEGKQALEAAEKTLDGIAAMLTAGLSAAETAAMEKALEVLSVNVKQHLQETFENT